MTVFVIQGHMDFVIQGDVNIIWCTILHSFSIKLENIEEKSIPLFLSMCLSIYLSVYP